MFKKKYTANKPSKQYSLLQKLTLGIVPIALWIAIDLVNLISHDFKLSSWSLDSENIYGINLIIFLKFWILVTTLIIISLIFCFSKYSPIWFVRTKIALKEIIADNSLYHVNDKGLITNCMLFKFYRENSLLIMDVHPRGGSFTSKMDELTRILETKLNMTVISVQRDSPKFTTYILSETKGNVINASTKWN